MKSHKYRIYILNVVAVIQWVSLNVIKEGRWLSNWWHNVLPNLPVKIIMAGRSWDDSNSQATMIVRPTLSSWHCTTLPMCRSPVRPITLRSTSWNLRNTWMKSPCHSYKKYGYDRHQPHPQRLLCRPSPSNITLVTTRHCYLLLSASSQGFSAKQSLFLTNNGLIPWLAIQICETSWGSFLSMSLVSTHRTPYLLEIRQ